MRTRPEEGARQSASLVNPSIDGEIFISRRARASARVREEIQEDHRTRPSLPNQGVIIQTSCHVTEGNESAATVTTEAAMMRFISANAVQSK